MKAMEQQAHHACARPWTTLWYLWDLKLGQVDGSKITRGHGCFLAIRGTTKTDVSFYTLETSGIK